MRRCTVCQHDDRLTIQQMMVNGKPDGKIAERFGLTRSAVQRHRTTCVVADIAAAKQAEAELRGMRIIDRIREFDRYVDEVIDRARNPQPVTETLGNGETVTHTPPPNDRLILLAVKEARANAELVAKALGDLPPEDGAESARKALHDTKAAALAAELEERISGQSGAADA